MSERYYNDDGKTEEQRSEEALAAYRESEIQKQKELMQQYQQRREEYRRQREQAQASQESMRVSKESVQKAIIKQEKAERKEAHQKRISLFKDKLTNTFGVFGIIIYILIQAIVYILPFVMIGGNFFLTLLLLGINSLIPFASAVFWIWGLVCAINGIQDIWAIMYYIVFVVVWIPYYINLITSFIRRK